MFVQSTTISFTAGETITGQTSGATATIDSLTAGDPVLTSRYLLDTGQRDSFYDIARIVRKKGRAAPILKPYSSVTIILSEAKKMESHGTKG